MKITRRQLKELIKEFVDTAAIKDIDTGDIDIQLDSDETLKEESVQIALQCIPDTYKKYITDDIINITKSILDKSKSNLSEAKEEKKKKSLKHLEGLDLNEFGISDDLITGNKLIFKDQDPDKGYASDEEIRAAVVIALIDHLEENAESMDRKILRATIETDYFRNMYGEQFPEQRKHALSQSSGIAFMHALSFSPMITLFYMSLFGAGILDPLKKSAGSESFIFEATTTGMHVMAVYLFFMVMVWGYYDSMKRIINVKEGREVEKFSHRTRHSQKARKISSNLEKATIDITMGNKEIEDLKGDIRSDLKNKSSMDEYEFQAGFTIDEREFINSEVDRLISERASSKEFEQMIKTEVENNPELQKIFAQRNLESEQYQEELDSKTQIIRDEYHDYLVSALDKIDNMIKIKKRMEDVKRVSAEELKELGVTGEKFNEELQDIEDFEDARATVARFKKEMAKKDAFMKQQQRRY